MIFSFNRAVIFCVTTSLFAISCSDEEPINKTPYYPSAGDNAGDANAAGDTAMGDTAMGDTSMGDTAMGDTSMGDTSMGDAHVGDTHMGDNAMGDTHMGDFNMGDYAMGDTNMGDFNMGDYAMGDYAMGDTNMGDFNMGDTHMGDYAMGDTSVGPGHLVINEIDYDSVSTDTLEFLEIYNAGGGFVDLASIVVIGISGHDNTEYARYAFDSMGALPPGGFLVLANTAVELPANTLSITLPTNGLENGAPDAVVLFDTATDEVIDALSYEGSITAAIIDGVPGTFNLVSGEPVSVGDGNSQITSLIRLPDGNDTGNDVDDWRLTSTPTPGAANMQTP